MVDACSLDFYIWKCIRCLFWKWALSTQKYADWMEMYFLNYLQFLQPYTAELMREIKWKENVPCLLKNLFLLQNTIFDVFGVFFLHLRIQILAWMNLFDFQPHWCCSQVPLDSLKWWAIISVNSRIHFFIYRYRYFYGCLTNHWVKHSKRILRWTCCNLYSL